MFPQYGALADNKSNPNSILARVNGRTQIDVQDVAECEDLFLDARRSAAVLASESGKGFIS
jgi:RuvB-like protein 1 (pontin 52)